MNRNFGLEKKQDASWFCIELKYEISMAVLWDMIQTGVNDCGGFTLVGI